MKAPNLVWLSALFFALSHSSGEARGFRVTECETFGESTMLTSKDEVGNVQHVTFMGAPREFAILAPRAKGIVSWANVKRIDVTRSGETSASLTIVFTGSRHGVDDTFNVGEVDAECLDRLKASYGGHLRFELSTN